MPQLMLPIISQCLLPEVHQPWLMVHDVGRFKGRPTNVHTPCLVHAGLGGCCVPLATITWHMRTCHVRFV